MRSSPPRREEDKSSYYELIVERAGALSLCRYEKPSKSAGKYRSC